MCPSDCLSVCRLITHCFDEILCKGWSLLKEKLVKFWSHSESFVYSGYQSRILISRK